MFTQIIKCAKISARPIKIRSLFEKKENHNNKSIKKIWTKKTKESGTFKNVKNAPTSGNLHRKKQPRGNEPVI